MEKKYLNMYDSEGDYGQKINDFNNKRSDISYVIGSGVHYGDTTYFGNEDAIAGDILLTNGTDKFFTTPEHYQTLKDEGKIGTGEGQMTPIGVCAVPAELTMLGEDGENKGKTRVVSLANMSLKTPEVGSISVGGVEGDNCMYWGDNTKILGISDWKKEKYIHPITGELYDTDWVRFPSTSEFEGSVTNNPHINEYDPELPMYFTNQYDVQETTRFGCSPYDTTGGFFSGTFSNLRGNEITSELIAKVTANWSGSTIENSHSSGNCPTACSCRRYHTKGTNVGDWYLPTIGELGIMFVRMKEINNSIYLVGPSYSIRVGTYKECSKSDKNWNNYGNILWTSIEHINTDARYLQTDSGLSGSASKSIAASGSSRTRAFLAL